MAPALFADLLLCRHQGLKTTRLATSAVKEELAVLALLKLAGVGRFWLGAACRWPLKAHICACALQLAMEPL